MSAGLGGATLLYQRTNTYTDVLCPCITKDWSIPYTVWDDFDAFRKNTVDMVVDDVFKGRSSRDYLYVQLRCLEVMRTSTRT